MAHSNPNFHRLDALAPSPQLSDISYPNPNVQGDPFVYLAVYSSVPVYEMMVRGIGVMRRRADSYLNATQILKVAGVDKGKRTKILEKDIALGVHEKVQGGYGRYQGTWIPFERAVELSNDFGVSHLLAPLFDYTAPPPPSTLGASASTSTKPRESGLGPDTNGKRPRESGGSDDYKRMRMDVPVHFSMGTIDRTPGLDDWQLRRSTKPLGSSGVEDEPLRAGLVDDPLRSERHKTILKSIFAVEQESTTSVVPNLSATFPSDMDCDTPIDDNDHTALHWAAALARISIVRALVNFGADMYRGNNAGETPLIRAVLVTNNSDQDAFERLLQVLGPSLRTVDETGRSVLHHAALVAGVKGRASSARYYMESILEYVAKHEGGNYGTLVDAVDCHGDTALNIAARVGNRGLVRMLLDVGADKVKPNKLGLRPGDFGVEGVDLSITAAEEAVSGLKSTKPSLPLQKSSEVIASLTSIITSLSNSFDTETADRVAALSATQSQLRTTTAKLTETRASLTLWRSKVTLVDEKRQRIKNLEKALAEEDSFDWTGRTEIDGTPCLGLPSPEGPGPAFLYRGPASTLSNLPAGISIEFDADPPPPANDTDGNSLVHLIRLKTWYDRVVGLLRLRVEGLKGGHVEQELKLGKIVAGCCGVEAGRVEGMLEGLLAALESDGSGLDMARVAGFLSRVKDGSLA